MNCNWRNVAKLNRKCRTGPCDIASKWMRIFLTLLSYSRMNFLFQNNRDTSKGEAGINRDMTNTMSLETSFERVFT
jgi:hypothetical protein